MTEKQFLLFFPFYFVGLWTAISLFISRVGGWHSLAQEYRATRPFAGQRYRMKSAAMRGGTAYSRVINFGANSEGLFLSILTPFRIGHPPLFIPWSDISVSAHESILLAGAELRFAKVPDVLLRMESTLARQILGHGPLNGQVELPPDADMAKTKILVAILGYLAVVLFIAALCASSWMSYDRFVRRGRPIVATVVKTTCENHATFDYEFEVDGRAYRGSGNGGYGNLECANLKPGDSVNAWYLPSDPDQSVSGNPRERRDNEAKSIVTAAAWFGLFFGFYIWRQIHQTKSAA